MSYIKKKLRKWLNKGNDVVTITRYHETDTEIIGLLFVNGIFVCHTLELPWKDNKRYVSCIPEGTYEVQKRSDSYKYRVKDVPGRTAIDIHVANSHVDIEGCIGLGTGVDKVQRGTQYYLTSSQKAMDKFSEIIGDNLVTLHVTSIITKV